MAFRKLRKGDKGLRVRALQKRLKKMEPGFDPGSIDGIFGEQTEKAVRKAEKWHGLDPDGKVGRTLYRKLHVKRALRYLRRKRRSRFEIIPRSRWNAQPAQGAIGGVAEPTQMHWLHCTVGREPAYSASMDEEAEAMRALQATAFARGFYDISYSFVHFNSGRVWEARGWHKAGAHTEGYNSVSFASAAAIECSGQAKVSDEMLKSFADLIAEGIRIGAISKSVQVRGHREVAAKGCPGEYLFAKRQEIQAKARRA